jgi:hypothetical protein
LPKLLERGSLCGDPANSTVSRLDRVGVDLFFLDRLQRGRRDNLSIPVAVPFCPTRIK